MFTEEIFSFRKTEIRTFFYQSLHSDQIKRLEWVSSWGDKVEASVNATERGGLKTALG